MNRCRTDSHDGKYLGQPIGDLPPSEIVEEEPLHVHRLFIRGQFARTDPSLIYGNDDGMIDYPSEIHSVIFLETCFVFLYDNRLYRSGYYDNYHYPKLVMEDRIVAICLLNEKMSQILVLFENNNELMILILTDDDCYSIQSHDHSRTQNMILCQHETLNYFLEADFLSYIQKYDMLMNANAFNGNQHVSPLQENYSVDIRYFSEFSIIVLACHPALEPINASNGIVEEDSMSASKSKPSTNNSHSRIESKVLEISINDFDMEGGQQQPPQEPQSLLAAKEILSISTQFLHHESIYSVWNGFDDISSKSRIFIATSYQDNVIYLWQVRLTGTAQKPADGEMEQTGNNSDQEDDPNEIFEEDEREAELAMQAMLANMPKTLVGEEDEEDEEDDYDDEDEDEEVEDEKQADKEDQVIDKSNEENEENEDPVSVDNHEETDVSEREESSIEIERHADQNLEASEAISNSFETKEDSIRADDHDQSTLLRENRKLMKIKTKHKAWITALSKVIPSNDPGVELPGQQNSDFVASGDKLGSIGLYCFSSRILHPDEENNDSVAHNQSAGNKKKAKRSRYDSKQGPWKICDFRNNVTGQHAITMLLLQPCYRSRVRIGSKLFAGDQSGKVTVLEISHKTSKMHILQSLSLFSSFGAVSTFSICPYRYSSISTTAYNNNNIENADPNAINSSISRLRCYSKDAGEAIECLLSSSMASVFKVWPESILQENIGKERSAHSSRFDSTIYKAQNLIDCCFTLIEKNIVIVSDFTKEMHLYDIKSGNLLLSITMPTDKCTCLLALPFIHSVRKPSELGQMGRTHSLEQWMNFANQQLQGLQDEPGITIVSGHKTGEVNIYHVYFPIETKSINPIHVGNDHPELDGSLMAGSSKTSQYHVNHPTIYSSEDSQLSDTVESTTDSQEDRERRRRRHLHHDDDEDWLSSSQGSMDDEVFDLLDSPMESKKEKNLLHSQNEQQDKESATFPLSVNSDDAASEVLHMKHHHHYVANPSKPPLGAQGHQILQDGMEAPLDKQSIRHPYYEIVQTLRPSPLHVTDLFYSSTGQFLISIHLKRFLFVFSNELHYKTLRPMIEEKMKLEELKTPPPVMPTREQLPQSTAEDKKKRVPSSKIGVDSSKRSAPAGATSAEKQGSFGTSNRISKKAAVVGPNISKSKTAEKMLEDDPCAIYFPKERYRFTRHLELDRNVYSITDLIPILLEDEGTMTDTTMKKDTSGKGKEEKTLAAEMEKEMELDKERLVLIISGPDSAIIGLLDAIDGVYLLKLPLPTIPLNLVNPATLTTTTSSVQSRVRSGLIWDFPIKGSKERSLVGLCPTTNPDQYLVFNEAHGFQLLNDQAHMALIKHQAFQQQQGTFSSSYYSSWQRDHLIGLQGFTVHSSPIVTAWSNYHCLLLRIQLHRDRGVLMMRSKHYFTHNVSPQNGEKHLNHYNNRIIAVKPLKKASYIRNHRVLVVLSNGYGIILHL